MSSDNVVTTGGQRSLRERVTMTRIRHVCGALAHAHAGWLVTAAVVRRPRHGRLQPRLDPPTPAPAGGKPPIGVALITKDSTNPFFVAMQKGAKADADKNNVKLTVASGKQEGDDQGQITAIEDAIARGDKGILITPMSTGVNAAIKKARDAGLFVIALDTPPDPANTVDITFATDNREAGKLDGQWAAATLDGKAATIALLDLFNDKIVSVDYNRDQGFLEGMGIPVERPEEER